jgi:hypothetical protein
MPGDSPWHRKKFSVWETEPTNTKGHRRRAGWVEEEIVCSEKDEQEEPEQVFRDKGLSWTSG